MRWITIIVLASIISISSLSSAAGSSPAQPRHVEHLRHLLETYSSGDTMVTKWATAVRGRFPTYARWMDQADRAGRQGGLRVDVILQRHDGSDQTLYQEFQMYYSQLRIRQLLDSLQYRVVGIEGVDLDRVTWPGLERAVIKEAMDYFDRGGAIDTVQCQLLLLRSIARVSGQTYFANHPQVLMLGTEDLPLHRLQMAVIRNLDNRPSFAPSDSTTIALFWAVVRARSELAFVKTILSMVHSRHSSGVVVIGLAHQPEMDGIARRYHVQSTIFYTEIPARLPARWWK